MIISTALNVLVTTIIDTYFQNSLCLFIFTENFEYRGSLPVVNVKIINNTLDEDLIFQNYGCQEIVIQNENPAGLVSEIETEIKLHNDRFNSRKYLIIPNEGQEENLSQLLDLPELEYIVDFLMVVPFFNKSNFIEGCEREFKILCHYYEVYKLVTHKYVGRNNNAQPEVLDLWFSNNQSFLYGNDLFPDKLTDQQGRALKCATFNYAPYAILESSVSVASGSENSVAHEYAAHHNMTVEYITDDDEWGIIYENWTGDGILGNLATDKADIGFGALYSWAHEFAFLDFSKPIVRSGITCLVPAPRLATGWLTPLFPFSTNLWIGTAISFIVIYLFNFILTVVITRQHLERTHGGSKRKLKAIGYVDILKETFSNVTRILLIQSVQFRRDPLTQALRYMFVIFLFSLLLTSIYSSGLASIMTIPRYTGSIETVLDLAYSDINWGATQDAWIFSILGEERPQYLRILEKFKPTPHETLGELAKTNHFAFSIERLPSGQYAIGTYITEDTVKALRLMHEDLYWEYCIFMLRKNSPLLTSIDKFVLQAAEAGLIYFWEMQAALTHMDLRVQNIVKYYASNTGKEQTNIVKLKFVHLEGAFGILVIGHTIATAIFLIEFLVHKYCTIETIII